MQFVSNLGGVVLLRLVSQQWYGILVFTLAVSCMAAGETSEGHRRAQELAHHYEIVHVDTSNHVHHVGRQRRSSDGESYAHPDRTQFEVSAFGNNFKLDLELNKILLPKKFQVRSYSANDELVINRNVVNCYYQGKASGFKSSDDSHAVVSTCNGISGSFGVGPAGYWTNDNTFFIEPLTSVPSANGTHLHAVFKAKDAKSSKPGGKCGVIQDIPESSRPEGNGTSSYPGFGETLVVENHKRLRRQAQSTLYVELLIVMDSTLYTAYSGNQATLANRARAVANFVDSVYRSLNIRVPLVAVEVFSNGNRFVTSTNANTMLDNFYVYRRQQLIGKIAHDNAQLMTGLNFDGSTIGLAQLSAMCAASSGAVNQDTKTSSNAVASTMAHEMGHNFGMTHDSTSRSCTCSATSSAGGCIMASQANPVPPRAWSSCSTSDLATFLGRGGATCLSNQPTQLFGSPVCGNGFVEGTEQCDCGAVTECTNRCCNAATCRFSTGSQCSDGPCCSNCQYRSTGTVCRPQVNSCDVAETCSGLTHTCPDNIFRQNGQSCGSGSSASFCYDGECNTHDAQCKRTWGTAATVAPQSCYNQNTRGSIGANCGFSPATSTYTPCTKANARCGTLQCLGGVSHTLLAPSSTTYTIGISSRGTQTVCKATRVTSSSDLLQVGYVGNGVVCAADSICVNNVCTSTASLGVTPCPSRGGRVCSGNGVCTNLNSCLCNTGWAGSDCSQSNSGPVNGMWSTWTTWSGCSHTCGTLGVRSRRRDCDNPPPSSGGSSCGGANTQQSTCNRNSCPVSVNGGWSTWGAWTGCSTTCGTGSRTRVRSCNNPSPSNGGRPCVGSSVQTGTCTPQSCPTWTQWSAFGGCSRSCGGGSRVRTRVCSVSGQCSGSSSQSVVCNTASCGPVPQPVNGVWSAWTSWSSCTQTCDVGTRVRTRNCNNPPPANGGLPCQASGVSSVTETSSCTVELCSVWRPWTQWSACSVSLCGGGVRGRMRSCPVAGRCGSITTQTEGCNLIACNIPVDGGVSEWTSWSDVNGNCFGCPAGVTRVRTRTCTMPSPRNGGRPCTEATSENGVCVCVAGGFTTWSSWQGNCEVVSNQNRTRSCTNPAPVNGGIDCSGLIQETRTCSLFSSWSTWAAVGNCSRCAVDPANNFQARARVCTTSTTAPCIGALNETRTCPECVNSSGRSSGLSSGGIAGLIIGLLIVFALIAGGVFFVIRRKQSNQSNLGSRVTRHSSQLQSQYVLAARNEEEAKKPTRPVHPPPGTSTSSNEPPMRPPPPRPPQPLAVSSNVARGHEEPSVDFANGQASRSMPQRSQPPIGPAPAATIKKPLVPKPTAVPPSIGGNSPKPSTAPKPMRATNPPASITSPDSEHTITGYAPNV